MHQICLLAHNMTRLVMCCRQVWIQSSCWRPGKPRRSAGTRQMAATVKNCRTTHASRWVWCRRRSVSCVHSRLCWQPKHAAEHSTWFTRLFFEQGFLNYHNVCFTLSYSCLCRRKYCRSIHTFRIWIEKLLFWKLKYWFNCFTNM